MNPVITSLFAIIDTLVERQVSYAVMGGLAVRIHAIPRPTNDVDLTISLQRQLLLEWYEELEEAGITVPSIYRTGWVDEVANMPLVKFKIYLDETQGVDLDVFIAESAFQESILSRRITAEIEERKIAVVSPEDLILLKLVANRPRDLLDVADILFVQGELDQAYMHSWALTLGIPDRLEKALTTD